MKNHDVLTLGSLWINKTSAHPHLQHKGLKTASVFVLLVFCTTIGVTFLHGNIRTDTLLQEDCFRARIISNASLGLLRFIITSICVSSCWFLVKDPTGIYVPTKPSSATLLTTKGPKIQFVHLKHSARFSTFTVQSWALLTFYFVCASFASLLGMLGISSNGYFAYAMFALYEVSLPAAIFVTSVVTFVLTPAAYMAGVVSSLLKPTQLMFHYCNIIFMCCELFFSRLHILKEHFALPILWGLMYCVFSWKWFQKTGMFFFVLLPSA
jgi:hypothetical protein